MSRWLTLGLVLATYLAAAKTHGRHLRLERELAGYWEVTFGATNPQFVETLWRRERVLYWSAAAALVLLSLVCRWLAPAWSAPVVGPPGDRSWGGAAVLHVLLPLTGAFLLTGLLSLGRLLTAARAGAAAESTRPAEWWQGAVWGTAAWWAVSLVLLTAACWAAWRRSG